MIGLDVFNEVDCGTHSAACADVAKQSHKTSRMANIEMIAPTAVENLLATGSFGSFSVFEGPDSDGTLGVDCAAM